MFTYDANEVPIELITCDKEFVFWLFVIILTLMLILRWLIASNRWYMYSGPVLNNQCTIAYLVGDVSLIAWLIIITAPCVGLNSCKIVLIWTTLDDIRGVFKQQQFYHEPECDRIQISIFYKLLKSILYFLNGAIKNVCIHSIKQLYNVFNI